MIHNEFKEKTLSVRKLMEQRDLAGVLFTTQSGFSWILCGATNYVSVASTQGCTKVLVTKNKVFLLANWIEYYRMRDEEIDDLPIECVGFDWFKTHDEESLIKKLVGDGILGCDADHPLGRNIAKDLDPLRYSLSQPEVERYVTLGARAEEALRSVALALRPGLSEFEIAGMISEEAYSRELIPVLALVAADDRIAKYRHPIPTDKRLKKIVMLVLCARYKGLIASLTRMVGVSGISADLAQRHLAVAQVDAAFIHNTRIGEKYSEIFRKGVEAYESVGYPDEWKLHHQGGATGYEGRDFKGTFDCDQTVVVNQAVAWNPSITGTKSEDTILCAENGNLILTQAKEWPMISVPFDDEIIERPGILCL